MRALWTLSIDGPDKYPEILNLTADSKVNVFNHTISNWGYVNLGDRKTMKKYVKNGTLSVHLHMLRYGELKEVMTKPPPASGAVRA